MIAGCQLKVADDYAFGWEVRSAEESGGGEIQFSSQRSSLAVFDSSCSR
jgi:hypothetical protein